MQKVLLFVSMKRIYTSYRYKRYQGRHILRENRRRLKSQKKRCFTIGHDKINPNISRYKYVTAPATFCIKENTEEVIKFVNRLNKQLNRRTPTFIDLSKVTDISYDAIVVLLSIISQFKRQHISFNGNFPDDNSCRKILNISGFFSSLYDENKVVKYDTSAKSKNKNIIRKHGKDASGATAKDLIKICSDNIWGKSCRCQGVYRILIELMQNTHAHANNNAAGTENWWLSVNYDADNNKECFSFVDYGIGVFTSLENKRADSKFFGMIDVLRRKLIEPDNAKVLKLILDGELHRTATGHSYRGKGLPGIKTALERNQISNLYIITNDAYANVCTDSFITLSNAFDGTFIYWELTHKNIKCDDNTAA